MKTDWLKKSLYLPLTWFTIAGLAIGSYVWFAEAVEIKWAAFALIFVFISLGLGGDNFLRAVRTEKRMNEMSAALIRIEDSLEEMRKKQEEQSSSGSTIAPTLQAFSQIYLDYLAKQKSEEEQQNYNDYEGSEEVKMPRIDRVSYQQYMREYMKAKRQGLTGINKDLVVGVRGFEPPTSASQTLRANQLRHTPPAQSITVRRRNGKSQAG